MGAVKEWIEKRQLFTSKISEDTCQSFQTQNESIMIDLLKQMDICARTNKNDEKAKAIHWLMCELCNTLRTEHYCCTFEPILTGSAAECTQALFIDEFDYVLISNSTFDLFDVEKTLKAAVLKMTNTHHPSLALKRMNLSTRGSFPCLYITWVDEHLRSTLISIDLVFAEPLDKPVTLPHHNFLPVPREHQPYYNDATQHVSYPGSDTSIVAHDDLSINTTKQKPRLFVEPDGADIIVFSLVENGLIKALPSHIIEGYRLAKAVRVVHVIKPIVKRLIELGVTLDIHKLIKSYYLKTCVFYLTKHYVYDDSDIERNNRWKWAIATFEKLREFVMLGNVKQFFSQDQYIFEGQCKAPECVHDEEDFTAPLPRYSCCRRRKARLLVIDQILRVLRESYERYH